MFASSVRCMQTERQASAAFATVMAVGLHMSRGSAVSNQNPNMRHALRDSGGACVLLPPRSEHTASRAVACAAASNAPCCRQLSQLCSTQKGCLSSAAQNAMRGRRAKTTDLGACIVRCRTSYTSERCADPSFSCARHSCSRHVEGQAPGAHARRANCRAHCHTSNAHMSSADTHCHLFAHLHLFPSSLFMTQHPGTWRLCGPLRLPGPPPALHLLLHEGLCATAGVTDHCACSTAWANELLDAACS